jgi:hypothetical protein
MKTLRLLTLYCGTPKKSGIKNSKSNKVFLTVDNGISHIFGPESMICGSEWKVNEDVQFNKQTKISFFDEDLIRSLSTTKSFRNCIVKENGVHKRAQTFDFPGNNANYILSFDII